MIKDGLLRVLEIVVTFAAMPFAVMIIICFAILSAICGLFEGRE